MAIAVVAGLSLLTPVLAQDDPITVGIFAPLTGPTALAGQALRNGVQIAVDQVNAEGGLLGR